MATDRGDWDTKRKGVAQGSTLGPFIFNVFENDLMIKIENMCDI